MFFIMGIDNAYKILDYDSGGMNICDCCGSYCRYNIYMTYMYLSLFFIPVIKWNKKYYAKSSCCENVYELTEETGKKIKNGEKVILDKSNMKNMNIQSGITRCKFCNYILNDEFEYCPKCGNKR